MRSLAVFLLLVLAGHIVAAPPKVPDRAQRFFRLFHQVRDFVQSPTSLSSDERERLELKLSQVDEATLREVLDFAFGPGLLYVDRFREDLGVLNEHLWTPSRREATRRRLEQIGFATISLELGRLSETLELKGQEHIAEVKAATSQVLEAEDGFLRAAGWRERFFNSVRTLSVVAVGTALGWKFRHELGLDEKTPSELVTLGAGAWSAYVGTVFLLWERTGWVDRFRKWVALPAYQKLVQAWARYARVNPPFSLNSAGAAALARPISRSTRAGALSDAALEGLMSVDLPESQEKIFETFLTDLEKGNHRRAMRILEWLVKSRYPSTERELSVTIRHALRIRDALEARSRRREVLWAAVQLTGIGLLALGANHAIAQYAPPQFSMWKALPNALLGALGARRLLPLVFRPHQYEDLQKDHKRDEERLRRAMDRLMDLNPSGRVVSCIAKYDAVVAAHQFVTNSAADALAARPNPRITRKLFKMVEEELGASQFAGARVSRLLAATHEAQRACLSLLASGIQANAHTFERR